MVGRKHESLGRCQRVDRFEVADAMWQPALEYLRQVENHYPAWYNQNTRWTLSAYALYVRDQMGDPDPEKARRLYQEAGLEDLVQLVRGYFKLDGHHIQFNVVDAATLRDAQAHPENHRDLIVRVAGYSDYFCDLGQALQDEIIERTEHAAF